MMRKWLVRIVTPTDVLSHSVQVQDPFLALSKYLRLLLGETGMIQSRKEFIEWCDGIKEIHISEEE
jgi:hypothetical protein